ncbi:MAG: hypothetical protein ACE5GX_05700 [Thermoanaerobaculia bacterium]
MARDIGDGYLLVNERTFMRMSVPDMERINFEMDRRLREIRGSQPDLSDTQALLMRNRRLQRITHAKAVLVACRRKRKL